MKNRKTVLLTAFVSLGLLLSALPTGAALAGTAGGGTPKDFSARITPAKPGRGETISVLPDALSRFWQLDDLVNTYTSKISEISELTPYSTEQASWSNYMSDSSSDIAKRRELFAKYDLFVPTNNVLSWNSEVDAESYRVIISQDRSFSTIEREYTVSGSTDSVTFVNPQTSADYHWQVIATKKDGSLVYSDVFDFSTATYPRTIRIEGVSNTRDLGGNLGLNGKRMKEGLLYRGMGLEAITDEGTEEFRDHLGIKTELDLRGVGEGKENFLNLSNYYHYPSPYDYIDGTTYTSDIAYLGSGSLVSNFGNAIKVLANKDNYPVYFHCSVGRDRTGWMGICLNFLCGVSEELTLKEFLLSLFSTSGAYVKGNLDFYNRYLRIRDYLNTFEGENLSEKTENYLVSKAGVTHADCENVRKILLGDTDTGFVPGTSNPDSYENLVKVTFRRYGESPIIRMVETGSLLEEPNVTGNGKWYHGNDVWDFGNDTVSEDLCLDYVSNDKCKVVLHYSGIEIPDDVYDVAYHSDFDFTVLNRAGYRFRVYDDTFRPITSLQVESDVTLNVVYSPISGYIPKANSRILISAGQSNCAGVGHYKYLETSLDAEKVTEYNNGYDNVLITGYSHGQYLEGLQKVYVDKNTMTVGVKGTFGYEIAVAERLSKAFPDETSYIVKCGYGGASLNYDYISPSATADAYMGPVFSGAKRGFLYDILIESVRNTIRTIEETTNTVPLIDGFIWMQGESDATLETTLNVYLTSFNALIRDFTSTFPDNISSKFAVYDAGIAESGVWPFARQMNAIKKSREDARNIYIDTNGVGLTTMYEPVGGVDTAHYDAACYVELGHLFADSYLKHIDPGYVNNTLTIEAPESYTFSIGDGPVEIHGVKAYFNGEETEAKLSFFSGDTSLFKITNGNVATGFSVGETTLRITAYHDSEAETIIVPVQVTR